MTSTDRDVLDRFHSIVRFGGICERERQAEHHKQSWAWAAGRLEEVQEILRSMRQFLGARRGAKADAALDLPPLRHAVDECAKGHPLVGPGADVYVNAKGWRQCRICRRGYDAARAVKVRTA